MNEMLKSRTTQNVAVGTGAAGLSGVGIILFVRSVWELPWPVEQDAVAAAIAMWVWCTFLGPVVSRLAAWVRTPSKFWVVLVAAALAVGGMGCATSGARFSERTYQDGVVASETDFRTSVTATMGSKLNQGAGDLSYRGPDWNLSVGNAANGLQAAGDPAGILAAIAPLLSAYVALQPPPQAPAATPAWQEMIAEMVREELARRR